MSIHNIQLNTLLFCFYAKETKSRSKIRDDVVKTIEKEQGNESNGGMDFHGPFWSDVKAYLRDEIDLQDQLVQRALENRYRKRLYPLLGEKFLEWWSEKKRWNNEGYSLEDSPATGRFSDTELNAVVRVNNILALKIGNQPTRYFYPYFSEEPALSEEAARIGLWVMKQALNVPETQLRILDVLRAKSYSLRKVPLQGNEENLFRTKYKAVLKRWDDLYDELS